MHELTATQALPADPRLGDETLAVLERVPQALIFNDRDGRGVYRTRAADEIARVITGRDLGSTLGETTWNVVDALERPLTGDRMPAEITRVTGEEFDDVEIGHRMPDGGTRWIRATTRRLNDDGPPFAVVVSLIDVTATRAARTDLSMANAMFAQAFSHAPIGMAVVSLDGRWLRVNPALCELFGYSEQELLAKTFQELTHPDDLESDLVPVAEAIEGKRSDYQLNKRYIRADGRMIWALLSVALVSDDAGKPLHFISQIQDVTDRRRLEQRLKELADHDYLTGLLNRRRFEEELDRQLERCLRHGERAALLLLDIDEFKMVNDSLGHAAGDDLLRKVSSVMTRRARGTDVVGRIGGDEFAAILVDSDEQGALQVARSLVAALRESTDGVSASVGITTMRAGDELDAVLARADNALYSVKKSGRDGVQLDEHAPVRG